MNGKNCVVKTENGDEIVSLKINVNSVGETSLLSLRPERVWVMLMKKIMKIILKQK